MVDQRPTPRLTELSHGAGCGCKLAPALLEQVLGRLAPRSHPDLLVGAGSGDDAAVWRLGPGRALVLTTDFFTPVVDDARTWGRIAATNAASDVYAMGGRPLLALNLVAWDAGLPGEVLSEVLAGADDVAAEAGFLVVGGHSVDDPEPKFGLAVVGEADPEHLLTNDALRPGQHLVLTKALGTGVITTATKRGVVEPGWEAAAVASMCRRNDDASVAAREVGARAATDVTGFGLVGHLGRMARESGVDVEVAVAALPLLPGAAELARDGCTPGGTERNLAWVGPRLDVGRWGAAEVALVADPQTSGGLLVGAEPPAAAELVERLVGSGHPAAVVGEVLGPGPGRVALR